MSRINMVIFTIYDNLKSNACPSIKDFLKMDEDVFKGFIDGYWAIALENFFFQDILTVIIYVKKQIYV